MSNIKEYLSKFGNVLDTKTGKEEPFSQMKYQYLGLYFTADWCYYCVKLLGTLPQLVKKVNASGEHLKIITLRLDETPSDFAYNYFKFPSLTYSDSALIASLVGATGLPSIYIFNYAGKLVSVNGLNDMVRN